MAKEKVVYVCRECGYEIGKWMGKCMSCGNFNTFELETQKKASVGAFKGKYESPKKLSEIDQMNNHRIQTKILELDRVLSGGFVQGSLTLVGGDPGIGKSTLLLQICENIGNLDKTILYVSGEESLQQIKLRAKRLNINTENLFVMAETNMTLIEEIILDTKPDFVILDSIQTVYLEDISSSAGSVTQTRECVTSLMRIAKKHNISVIIVGHVTKDGALAGPKVLEHLVDTVIYFEGEKTASYRIIRTVKNRFGSTNEVGVFEMKEEGLVEINNPSEYMLSGRPLGVSGSVVTCSIEGTRPILSEVQALVSYTNFGQPRRTANGLDYNRVVMLLAVLEKRCNMQLSNYDAYINIAGGMKIVEPALDTSVISSVWSCYKNIAIDPYTLVFGEVGLSGEIRGVTMADRRVQEAAKLGFKKCIIPEVNMKGLKVPSSIKVYGVSNVSELIRILEV